MRISLINPPLYMKPRPIQIYYPTGLLYVASYLRENGHVIDVVDAPASGWRTEVQLQDGCWYRGLSFDEILDRLTSFKPDIIGLTTCFSLNASSTYNLTSYIKNHFDVPIVYGGAHASVKSSECLQHSDYVVIGEGEVSMLNLVNALERGMKPERIIKSSLINNLDKLPFPARDLIPMKEYFESSRTSLIHGIKDMRRWASMITSRGCIFNCNFCAIHLTMGREWRARSPINVINEIDSLVTDYEIEDVVIEDDNATFNPKRMKEICDLLIEREYGLNLYVPNGVRADTLDSELLLKMKEAGFKEIWIAPESGSQRVVDEVIGKKLDLKHVERVVKKGSSIGLKVSCFFVIGNPGETLKEMEETIEFGKKLRELGMYRYSYGFATPYWGTRLYKECEEKGYLLEGFDNNSITPQYPSIITPDWSISDLQIIRAKLAEEWR